MRLDSALLTDLYQLTMLQGYVERDMSDEAVFEFFVRRLPPERNFLVAAGLEQALDYLEGLAFTADEVAELAKTGLFTTQFLDWLARFRFAGHVDAMPEGTVFFADEPVLRVTAPLPQAQFVESRLVNLLHYQTLVASKAARCVLAAPGKLLVDFGMRRAHGSEAALLAARASFLAGFAGTATVLARALFDIPIFGTMAHSFIEAHDSEIEAFEHFTRSHRGAVVLLIDTYDTETGARRVVEIARRLGKERVSAVRLDSGDLDALSRRVRSILDDAGLEHVTIFASGGLDELKIARLCRDGAPIDGFGVGTSLDVSEDRPALDCVYKIQEYAGVPRRKRSRGKATWPGRKQVFRRYAEDGVLDGDTLTLLGQRAPGEPLLQPVMRDGRRIGARADLKRTREHARAELARLPAKLAALDHHSEYAVDVAMPLKTLAAAVDAQFG